MSIKEILNNLRTQMLQSNINAYIIPSTDEFQNEYTPPQNKRLEFLTGFTGSNGIAIILQQNDKNDFANDKAAFFTDGRYILQAQKQLDKNLFEVFDYSEKLPHKWLEENLHKNNALGYNPILHTKSFIKNYQQFILKSIKDNLIDKIWLFRPKADLTEIFTLEENYSGKNHLAKINDISKKIKAENCEAYVITLPDSVCWLLNVRAHDIEFTPFALSLAILYFDGKIDWFIDETRVNKNVKETLGEAINIKDPKDFEKIAKSLSQKKILLDTNIAPIYFSEVFKDSQIIDKPDICVKMKATKNKTEIEGAKLAHIIDGAAVTKFLYYLANHKNLSELTEFDLGEIILKFRQESPDFIYPSFATIAGFAANGAIVHYRAEQDFAKKIIGASLLLVDSGGQYKYGTTDITRTIAIGTPTSEQINNFTLVLKGHIALANAIFPHGTSGSQLDILARQYLWKQGLDYAHGTGHGVGSFLSVHEGPQRISKVPNNIDLLPGMIVSNEPGYYKTNEYGIRIENLVVVEEANLGTNLSDKPEVKSKNNNDKFYCFKTLTRAPFDAKLVNFTNLTSCEKLWLKNYHMEIIKDLSPLLDKKLNIWLEEYCVRFVE